MPKYAQYDHTAASPQPVIGWYDSDEFTYASLPATADLLTLTKTQWDTRLSTPFVSGGALVAAPAPTAAQLLTAAKTAQIATLSQAYAATIQQPVSFTSAGGVAKIFQTDSDSLNKLQQMITAYSSGTPTGFYWKSADNTKVPFGLADMKGLALVAGNQGWAAFENLQTKSDSVNTATTVAAVVAITF